MVQIRSSMSTPGPASECPSSPCYSVASEFHPHSNGVPANFPTSPAIAYPSAIYRNLQSPEDVQALALNQSTHATDAISTPMAKCLPRIPYPMIPFNSPQPPQQLLEQQEARWHERFQTHVKELENKFSLQSQEHREECHQHCNEWYERCEKQTQEIQKKSDKITILIVEPSPPIFPTISN